ncbi:hypothetical protein tb265_48580 [Gemmatimonadetes bacterium T265]|nr:hypothetical protein tb265_48580 [Gemmatimonadetes bacterium T265]
MSKKRQATATAGRAKGARRRVRTAPIAPPDTLDLLPPDGTVSVAQEAANGPDGDGRRTRARMAVAVEAHGIGRHARRFDPDDEGQFAFELRYPRGDGGEAHWRVTADNNTAVVLDAGTAEVLGAGSGVSALQHVHKLPGPLAHDLLVVVGEDVNQRTRRRSWNARDIADRTFEWSMTELLTRMGKGDHGTAYQSLRETLIRMARLRIQAAGGAGREGKRWTKRTVVFGLIDRLEILEEPGETRVQLTISHDLAQTLTEDFRLLPTDTYWDIRNGPARRLYQVLDLARYAHDHRGTAQLRVPVHYLRDRVPVDEQKTTHLVRKLDAMHEELVRVRYLAAMPTYAEATGDDLRRFPTYPGKRAKMLSAVYEIVPAPAGQAVLPASTGNGGTTLGDTGGARGGESTGGMAAEKAALLASLGVVRPERSDLHGRVLEVQQLCGDGSNVGLYTALCKALPDEVYRRVVATVRADRPQVPRAAFVRLARDELQRYGIEIPAAATDRRVLAELLREPG